MQPNAQISPLLDRDAEASTFRIVENRRRNLAVRLISAFAVALMNGGAVGFPVVFVWLAAYLFSQLVELLVLRSIVRSDRGQTRFGHGITLSILFVNTLVFDSLAIPLWLSATWMGPAVAILMLVGAMANAAVIGRGMKSAFLVCFVPHVIMLFIGPYLAARATHTPLQIALSVGPIVIALNLLSNYWSSERLRRAEAQAKAEVERRRIEAVAATEAKSHFVATVSHDLRTPLTAILASAGAIRRDASDTEEMSRAAMICDAAKMMRSLLDDLLDMSKIEAGHMSVEVVTFDPQHLIDDVARFWSEEAARKGLVLTVSVTDALPPRAGGDPTRIRQVLNNLLSNAVKFTQSGGIMIETAAAARIDGGHALSVTVADTGPGMTEEQLDRLFTPFDQTDSSIARKHGGTGLGLAISRELSRLMGGDLTAQSRAGEGARFVMICTLAKADGDLPLNEAEIVAPSGVEDLRVLVVDDHELNRRAMTLLLEPIGVTPLLAASGEEALVVLAGQPFDLVLMDLNMTGLDGRETTRRLRAAEGPNQAVPVVAVTGSSDAKSFQSCRDAGMDACVEKPLEPQALYAAIEQVLAKADGLDRAAA